MPDSEQRTVATHPPLWDRAVAIANLRFALQLVRNSIRWGLIAIAVGTLSGLASFAFLHSLRAVTDFRVGHPWMLALLPGLGAFIGWSHQRLGRDASGGTNAVIAAANGTAPDPVTSSDGRIEPGHSLGRLSPFLAPVAFVGALLSHIGGASVGREGTGVALAGGIADQFSGVLRLSPSARRGLLRIAIAAGFGSMFGMPVAGAIFGIEVPTVGRVRLSALGPALVASLTGNFVVIGLGFHQEVLSPVRLGMEVGTDLRTAALGIACGLAAVLFVKSLRAVRKVVDRITASPTLRGLLGGVATAGLAVVVGHDYLGLSLPLLDTALQGVAALGWWVFLLKVLFTVIALGTGFPGGEVMPLFVIGATLGSAFGPLVGLAAGSAAALGMLGVFASTTNTPLATIVLGVELFGGGSLAPVAIACVVAHVVSSDSGVYSSQRWAEDL